MQQITCVRCGDRFEVSDTDADDARTEATALFPDSDLSAPEVVCDDCYAQFLLWMKANELTGREDEDRDKLRRLRGWT